MKNWSNVYGYTRMTFGRYRGRLLRNLPLDYIEWGKKNITDRDVRTALANELVSRKSQKKNK
jgi:hypothetical protein